MLNRRQRAQCGIVAAGSETCRAPHDHAAQLWSRPSCAPYRTAKIRFCFRGDRATIEDGDIGLSDIVHDAVARTLDHRARGFRVVMIRAATEGAQVHAHWALELRRRATRPRRGRRAGAAWSAM